MSAKNTYQESALLLVDLGERRDLCEPGVVLDGLVLQLREAPHAELGHAGPVGEVLREEVEVLEAGAGDEVLDAAHVDLDAVDLEVQYQS